MKRRRRRWLWLIILLMAIGVGVGYYYYPAFNPQPEEIVAEAPATTQVRRGDITLTAIGVGTLLPSREVNLGFGTSGIVNELTLQVGDRVVIGDVLVKLDDTVIRQQIAQSAFDLRLAELELAALKKGPSDVDIAAAQATLAAVQADYEALLAPPNENELAAARNELLSAQQTLETLLAGLSTDEETTLATDLLAAEIVLRQAQADYDQIAWRDNVGSSSQAVALQEATIAYERALAQYNVNTAGPKQEVLTDAQTRISQAQAQLDELEQGPDPVAVTASETKIAEAVAQFEDLMAGPTIEELEMAELAVQRVIQNQEALHQDLDGTLIVSPLSGVVTTINAQTGEQVGAEAIITVAEFDTAQIRFWVEELDIISVAPGNPVSVLFEAFPDLTYSGEIVRVEPTLVEVDGAQAVQAWASINLTEHPVDLLFGMNAEVEIIAGETTDAVLVPVQALRELTPGNFAVFVADNSGELEFRPIEVGLRDFVNAEVLSGLAEGDVVSTGTVATQ